MVKIAIDVSELTESIAMNKWVDQCGVPPNVLIAVALQWAAHVIVNMNEFSVQDTMDSKLYKSLLKAANKKEMTRELRQVERLIRGIVTDRIVNEVVDTFIEIDVIPIKLSVEVPYEAIAIFKNVE